MGIFNKIFGGADGIREWVHENYIQQISTAKRAGLAEDELHAMGVYGVLSARYIARRKPQSEKKLFAEIFPFVEMKGPLAIEMLAEYIVYQEIPNNARFDKRSRHELLGIEINKTLNEQCLVGNAGPAGMGIIYSVDWCNLLELKTIENIRKSSSESHDVGDESAEWDDLDEQIVECPKCGQSNISSRKCKSPVGTEWIKCPACGMNFQGIVGV